MIHIYFLGTEAFVLLGYLLGSALFPKRYPLLFYKFFGITIFSLLLWYLSSFTGAGWTNLIPLTFGILLTAAAIVTALFKNRLRFPTKRELLVFLGVELISYVLYLFLIYIRTYKPDIFGTEKLMDVALINAIMKQNHIPIENPWLSGFYMNYYYFGHFILALFQYLFQVPTAVGYNLAISLFGIWIAQAGYLVVKALRIGDLGAFLISLLMTFGGNFYLLIQVLTHTTANQWFASATRVIPFTINEFPAYSIVLGDLHGHYLSYPFFLLGVFLLLDMFFPKKEELQHEEWILPKSIFLGILLGHLYLTNSWDIFTLALLGVVIVLALTWYMKVKRAISWKGMYSCYVRLVLLVGLPIIAFSLPQFLASRSYYLPPVGGIGFNTVYSNPCDMFMLFGQFVLTIALGAGLLLYLSKKLGKKELNLTVFSPKIALPILLIFLGILVIYLVEFVYAKDIFSVLNPPYARTNTVFKMYFHAWSLLALGSISFFVSMLTEMFVKFKNTKFLFLFYGAFSVLVAIMLSYSVISINQYIAPKFAEFTIKRAIDPRWNNGYAFMKDTHGSDYELISYLLTKPSANILEIIKNDDHTSYTYYGRISSYSGMSAVSGWPLHNVQWYNGYEGKGRRIDTGKLELIQVAERAADVELMYTSTDKTVVENLLKKYQITYAVFGELEQTWAKEKDKQLNNDVYKSLCRVEWQQNETTLFNCRN